MLLSLSQQETQVVSSQTIIMPFADQIPQDIFQDLSESEEFENIDSTSLCNSQEFSAMRSLDLSTDLEADPEEQKEGPCEETMIDKILNFSTNLKYAVGGLSQKHLPENQIVVFGKEFTSVEDFMKQFKTVIWCTYRKNIPRILAKEKSFNEIYTNDTSWGCMIRATQMMFAEVLTRHMRLSAYQPDKIQETIIASMLEGEDISELAPYSIHSICRYLYENLNAKPGKWYKASQTLLGVEALHKMYRTSFDEDLEIAIFLEGTIYLDQILNKVCPEPNNEFEDISLKDYDKEVEEEKEVQKLKELHTVLTGKAGKTNNRSFNDLYEDQNINEEEIGDDLSWYFIYILDSEKIDHFSSSSSQSSEDATEEAKARFESQMKSVWSRSIFFVVLAKVGLDEVNPEYIPCIKELLSYPESVGMIGGKPGSAYYFLGYQNDDLIYLDPHFVQDACLTKQDISKHMDTYFCDKPRTIDVSKIDTSIALGFYINNAKDFAAFVKRLQKSARKSSAFFGFEKYSPVLLDLEDDNVSFDDANGNAANDGEYTIL